MKCDVMTAARSCALGAHVMSIIANPVEISSQ